MFKLYHCHIHILTGISLCPLSNIVHYLIYGQLYFIQCEDRLFICTPSLHGQWQVGIGSKRHVLRSDQIIRVNRTRSSQSTVYKHFLPVLINPTAALTSISLCLRNMIVQIAVVWWLMWRGTMQHTAVDQVPGWRRGAIALGEVDHWWAAGWIALLI